MCGTAACVFTCLVRCQKHINSNYTIDCIDVRNIIYIKNVRNEYWTLSDLFLKTMAYTSGLPVSESHL